MAWDVLIARFVHIAAALVWTGTGFSIALWWGPASLKAGKAGEEYWRVLVHRTPFIRGMNVLTLLTVVAGLYLYWRLNYLERLSTTAGVVLSIGAVAGIVMGILTPMHGAFVRRLWRMREETGPSPTAEQTAQIEAMGRRLVAIDILTLVLGFVAIATMATARYW